VAAFIKINCGCRSSWADNNLRVYPQESLMNEVADFGCVNSALVTLPRLLEELSGSRRFDDVPGLVFKRENGEIVQTPSPDKLEKFSDYPFPWRRGLPNELYEEFRPRGRTSPSW
jgi:hypothetical protein